MLPPAAVERAARDGLTSIASILLANPKLSQAAALTMTLLQGRLAADVVEKASAPFEVEISRDGMPRLKLAVETAAALTELSNPDRQSFTLVRTTTDLPPALARAWVEALAKASFALENNEQTATAWERLTRLRDWAAAWEGAAKPSEKQIAAELWTQVSAWHDDGNLSRLAKALGASSITMGHTMTDLDVQVALHAGQYRALFTELGRRAASVDSREPYLQLYYRLARVFTPSTSSLITVVKKIPGAF